MRFIYLSSADGNKKLFDSRLQMGALPRQRACGLQNLRRCSAGLNGAFANVGDVGRNFRSPGRGLTDIGGNLSSHDALLSRIIEAGWLSRYHPLASTRLATRMNPIGIAVLATGGPVLAPVFAVFYGAGNGILTIARGTLPLALFGPHGFGRRVGVLSLPARATGAVAPLAVGLLAEYLGAGALWMTVLASGSALIALFFLRARKAP
jgi:hypothetical protein